MWLCNAAKECNVVVNRAFLLSSAQDLNGQVVCKARPDLCTFSVCVTHISWREESSWQLKSYKTKDDLQSTLISLCSTVEKRRKKVNTENKSVCTQRVPDEINFRKRNSIRMEREWEKLKLYWIFDGLFLIRAPMRLHLSSAWRRSNWRDLWKWIKTFRNIQNSNYYPLFVFIYLLHMCLDSTHVNALRRDSAIFFGQEINTQTHQNWCTTSRRTHDDRSVIGESTENNNNILITKI